MPSNQYDLSFIAKFVNRASKGIKTLARDLDKLGKASSNAGASAKLTGSTLEEMTEKTRALEEATLNARVAIGTMFAGISAWAVKGAFDYDESLRGIVLSSDKSAKEIGTHIKALSEKYIDLSIKYGRFSAKNIAETHNLGQKLFGDLKDLSKRTEAVVHASFLTATKDARHGMTLIGQIMQAYGKTSLVEFEKLATILPMISQKSMGDFDALSHAMGRAAPLAYKLGVSYEALLAQFMSLSRVVGGKAHLVGFQLATLYKSLADYPDVAEVLDTVRIAAKNVKSEFYGKNPFIVFLEHLKEFAKDPEVLKDFYDKIGARGAVAAIHFLKTSTIKDLDSIISYMKDLDKLQQTNLESTVKVTTGLLGPLHQFNRMAKALEGFRVELGRVVAEAGKPWFETATKSLEFLIARLRDVQDILGIKPSPEMIEREKKFLRGELKHPPGERSRAAVKERIDFFTSSWKKLLSPITQFLGRRGKQFPGEMKSTFETIGQLPGEMKGKYGDLSSYLERIPIKPYGKGSKIEPFLSPMKFTQTAALIDYNLLREMGSHIVDEIRKTAATAPPVSLGMGDRPGEIILRVETAPGLQTDVVTNDTSLMIETNERVLGGAQ